MAVFELNHGAHHDHIVCRRVHGRRHRRTPTRCRQALGF
jgi:hypothetical protein